MTQTIRDGLLVLGALLCFLALMYFLNPKRHAVVEEGTCTDRTGRQFPCLAEP